jgi:hypothetical protein
VEVVAGVDAAATFALEGHPTAAVGRFRWRLRLGEGGAGADLGAVVKASHQPRVLLTQESATWEFARLHEWLTGAGSEIVLRTRVSADRWRLVGAAGPQLESPALTPALLARFDVLIATEESLRGLSSDERTVLEAVVRSDGLGVLIVGEPTAGTVATPLTPWQLTPAGSDAESIVRTTRLRLVGGRDWPEPMEVWAANWQAHALMRAVVRDPQGGLLVAVEPLGRGRLARSLVAASWRWPLAGHASDYAALWREILGVVARPEAIGGGWRLGPGASVISVGRPIDVTWLGEAGSAPPVARLRFDHETEAMSWRLQSRVDRPGEAWTRWWPARPGWHRLEDEVGHGLELYVSGPGQWPGIERALRQDATRELVRATANVDASQAGAAEARDWLRWRWAAWAAFVISVGALWWRERSAM